MARWMVVLVLMFGCSGAPGRTPPTRSPHFQRAEAAFAKHRYERAAKHYRSGFSVKAYRYPERHYYDFGQTLFLARQFSECSEFVAERALVAYPRRWLRLCTLLSLQQPAR